MNPLALKPGTVIDGYEVVSLLGRGGMGAVYRVRRGEAEYALKALAVQDAEAESEDVLRFKREGELLAQLRHRAVVRVNAAGEKPGLFYYVMRLVDGESLEQRLKRQGKMPPDEAVALILEIGSAIAHAHEKGIVHRDLKPANILIDKESGQPLVTDFGLARRLDEKAIERLTKTGEILGTPAYLAPEQAFGLKSELDEKTDVYGLGALFYAMLAGCPPFKGPSALSIMTQVSQRPPPPLEGVPPELEAVVLRAMAKKREDRPPSVEALLQAIEKAAQKEASAFPKRAVLLVSIGALAALLGATLAARTKPLVPEKPGPEKPETAQVPSRVPPKGPNPFELALEKPSLPETIAALTSLEKERVPPELAPRVARAWLDRARELDSELKPFLHENGAGALVFPKTRQACNERTAAVVDALVRAHLADPATDSIPEEAQFTLIFLLAASRNDSYSGMRGSDWLVLWERAFKRWPDHPVLAFMRGQSRHDEALKNAAAIEKALGASPPRSPAKRVLAFHTATDLIGGITQDRSALELRQKLARYSGYVQKTPSHSWLAGDLEGPGEPFPDELIDMSQLLGPAK